MVLLKLLVEIRCCGAEKHKLPRLLRRVHSLTYQLRGALKTSHCDVFLTGCSIPLIYLVEIRCVSAFVTICHACCGVCIVERFCNALAKNVPPARFLNARLRFPLSYFRQKQKHLNGAFVFGGDKGNRTPDLLNANQALYHLSYTPTCI